MVCCPITSQAKRYPFEVPVTGCNITGVILVDAVKNLDWRARPIDFICAAPQNVLDEVSRKLKLLLPCA